MARVYLLVKSCESTSTGLDQNHGTYKPSMRRRVKGPGGSGKEENPSVDEGKGSAAGIDEDQDMYTFLGQSSPKRTKDFSQILETNCEVTS
ncbi:hypothetical protein C5167_003629 [Papaver somniferum]|uniref:Uncharacterized protein n=1 Tax=Papaver somniferum TaxID=3469 RepID=A0A4Y7L462_PAPSO|nr:hypothetical protein C5167_003629 [Papaver somniferum]